MAATNTWHFGNGELVMGNGSAFANYRLPITCFHFGNGKLVMGNGSDLANYRLPITCFHLYQAFRELV